MFLLQPVRLTHSLLVPVLSDLTKRNIYDNYGSLGLYIAEQFGGLSLIRLFRILKITISPFLNRGKCSGVLHANIGSVFDAVFSFPR